MDSQEIFYRSWLKGSMLFANQQDTEPGDENTSGAYRFVLCVYDVSRNIREAGGGYRSTADGSTAAITPSVQAVHLDALI